MRGWILRDDYELDVPVFQTMYVGDSKKPEDFSKSEALSKLGPRVRILVDIDTTHSGTRINNRCYPAKELQRALPSWIKPYPRPFLKQHPARGLFSSDDEPDVWGRVQSGKFIPLGDNQDNDWVNPPLRARGSGWVLNSVLVTDKDAVEGIIDERILTVSVGLKADAMICPICLTDWVPSMIKNREPPEECEHRAGNTYPVDAAHFRGKMPFYHVARKILYDHIASTIRPAQPYASVLGFEIVDAYQEQFQGEALSGTVSSLALCDEAGHVVRLTAPAELPFDPPPLGDGDALVLASMEAAGMLDLSGEHADGYDPVAIRVAIDKVKASGHFTSWKSTTKGGPRLGSRGAIPAMTDNLVNSGLRFLSRYTGADKDTLGVQLLAAKGPMVVRSEPSRETNGGNGMTKDQIIKMSEEISAKLESLEDGCSYSDEVLKGCLDAVLFEKVSFANLSAEELQILVTVDRDMEIDGVASGAIDKVLTTESRKKLPDSAFCGPGRTFPAHDKAHIRNALARLGQGFPKGASSSAKARILACVRSRAKSADVSTSEGSGKGKSKDSADNKELLDTIQKLEKEAADKVAINTRLAAELKDASEERDKLLTMVHENLAQRVFDLRAKLGKKDVVKLSDEKAETYRQKLADRTLVSLEDALADLKAELPTAEAADSDAQAGDPNTLQEDQAGDGSGGNSNDTNVNQDADPGKPIGNIEKCKLMFRHTKG